MTAGPVLDLMAALREAMKPQSIFTSGGAGLLYCVLCKKRFRWGGPATNHAKSHEARGEAHWRMSGIGGRDDEWLIGPRPTAQPERRKSLSELTKDERSLLLFFETNAVDQGGTIDLRHMNDADTVIAERWHKETFIEFGRIAARSLPIGSGGRTHYVVLGPEALALAQEERRARIERLSKSRTWMKARETVLPRTQTEAQT